MAEVIRMPKMSDTMETGVMAEWLKKEGDTVRSGDVLAEVETDKATMELESYQDGILLHIAVEKGASVPVDAIIAVIGKKGEDYQALLKGDESSGPPAAKDTGKGEEGAPEGSVEPAPTQTEGPDSIKAVVVKMPLMSDTMTSGIISKWLKKVGDKVRSGDILAEIETDKATMELENYEEGEILYLGAEEGDSVLVNSVLAVIGQKGVDFSGLLTEPSAPQPVEEAVGSTASSDEKMTSVSPPAPPAIETARMKASPLAKRLAKDRGIDIHQVAGTGPDGRVIRRDIDAHASVPSPGMVHVPSMKEHSVDSPVSPMRGIIARRLSQSKFSAPHFYITAQMGMDTAISVRKTLNESSEVKISFNDIIVKAVAHTLRKHPHVNASWAGDKISQHRHIHIGVAVAVAEGLMVPVLKFVDSMSLTDISRQVKDLAGRAREKKLSNEEMTGNTFTVSNLGMLGVEEFTAIINPPDACILAVGAIREVPVVRDGSVAAGHVMKVTLSCDHRIVDGMVGAAFLDDLKFAVENPARMLL